MKVTGRPDTGGGQLQPDHGGLVATATSDDLRTLHGTTAGRVRRRRRALSTRWLGDDVTYCRRPGETSPPFPDIGLRDGDPMRKDWFPIMWRKGPEPGGSPPA